MIKIAAFMRQQAVLAALTLVAGPAAGQSVADSEPLDPNHEEPYLFLASASILGDYSDARASGRDRSDLGVERTSSAITPWGLSLAGTVSLVVEDSLSSAAFTAAAGWDGGAGHKAEVSVGYQSEKADLGELIDQLRLAVWRVKAKYVAPIGPLSTALKGGIGLVDDGADSRSLSAVADWIPKGPLSAVTLTGNVGIGWTEMTDGYDRTVSGGVGLQARFPAGLSVSIEHQIRSKDDKTAFGGRLEFGSNPSSRVRVSVNTEGNLVFTFSVRA